MHKRTVYLDYDVSRRFTALFEDIQHARSVGDVCRKAVYDDLHVRLSAVFRAFSRRLAAYVSGIKASGQLFIVCAVDHCSAVREHEHLVVTHDKS
jgi:hypothetical protein